MSRQRDPRAGWGLLACVVGSLFSGPVARPQLIPQMDPSARSMSMGGVAMATFWEPATASWKNPALLGYAQGLELAWNRTEWALSITRR
jgi:hypothetical protein